MKKTFLLALLGGAMQLQAQNVHLEVACTDSLLEKAGLYGISLEKRQNSSSVKLTKTGNRWVGEVPAASDGFYGLYYQNNSLPVYLPDASKEYVLNLSIDNGCPTVDVDADNIALSAFNRFMYSTGRVFWTDFQGAEPGKIKALLESYSHTADSLAAHYRCSEPVRRYLSLWAYTLTANLYESIPNAVGLKREDVPFHLSDITPAPETMLDTPMASYFGESYLLIMQTLPKGNLLQQLEALYGMYQCEKVRKDVATRVVDSFISHFKYDVNYEEGLAELTAAVQRFDLEPGCLDRFKKRKATVKGSPFPTGVVLSDAAGHQVDFATFKGSYVYIDLWASWCGPCCKEVPYLQKLEKELQNKDVKFVSISIDKKEAPWKAKMKALNMEGNQLHNPDNSLAEALNVNGIPFFLIYDKEGNLYMYNAPRPSHPALKELLESLH